MIAVRLEGYEVEVAVLVGSARNKSAIKRESRDVYPCDPVLSWGQHVEAAGAEMAVAKYLGLYWDGSVDTYRSGSGDLPYTNIDVKHSKDGKWKVKEKDDGELILVKGTMPDYIIEAYCLTDEVKNASAPCVMGNAKLWFVSDLVKRHDFTGLRKALWRRAFDARQSYPPAELVEAA
ncbi:MAG: hypothetical protein EBT15_12170 [Betaproteobacteria bacterium]|nr:hypothetical protein [Betaproteobacteria bacterium]